MALAAAPHFQGLVLYGRLAGLNLPVLPTEGDISKRQLANEPSKCFMQKIPDQTRTRASLWSPHTALQDQVQHSASEANRRAEMARRHGLRDLWLRRLHSVRNLYEP